MQRQWCNILQVVFSVMQSFYNEDVCVTFNWYVDVKYFWNASSFWATGDKLLNGIAIKFVGHVPQIVARLYWGLTILPCVYDRVRVVVEDLIAQPLQVAVKLEPRPTGRERGHKDVGTMVLSSSSVVHFAGHPEASVLIFNHASTYSAL